MAHMILDNDKGAVGFYETYGGTWHQMPQYEEMNGPVPQSKVHRIFNFNLEKEQLVRAASALPGIDHSTPVKEPVNSWCIVRADTDDVLVPSVGAKFDVMSHEKMFEYVEKGLLQHYPDLDIESAGTLENGATSFVNLKVKEIKVRGDQSDNLCRMMFYNPLGRGCYALGVHNVRIVCNNTLQASEAQASANNSLKKIRHTQSAGERINDALVDLAEVRMGLDSLEEQMNELAREGMSAQQVHQFLEGMFPISEDLSQAGATKRKKKQQRLDALYDEAEGLDPSTARTKYSMLQAVLKFFDHPEALTQNQDQMAVTWDGIIGARAQQKQGALNALQTV